MRIKDWFENKIESEHGGFVVEVLGVERETEKAYLLSIEIGYSSDISKTINVWVPKSCTMTEEEYEKEQEEMEKKIEDGLAYNEKLLAFAKENLVKGVRKGMRTVTLISKIREAGLEVPVRA